MPSLWVTGPDGTLLPLESAGYASEDQFQGLLAEQPELLATALDGATPSARWLLIARELSIRPDEESTRWSLDHLFLSPDGVPVLVEVKRSSDPRARREVVAQMLDYAASFPIDWSADRLRQRWEARVPDTAARETEMDAFLDGTAFEDEGQLWAEVQTKIEARRFRLLFVADRLSATLVRIIEFLNEQLKTTEVLGVEVRRHAGAASGVVAYEPIVRGRTAAAASGAKSTAERRSVAEFEATLEQHHGAAALAGARALIAQVETFGGFVSIGAGERSPRLFFNFRTGGSGRTYWPLAINPRPGKLALFLRFLKHHPAFEDEAVRADLVDRMAEAAGAPVHGDNLGGFPWLPVQVLEDPALVDRIADVLRWVVATADASAS